MKPKRGLRPEEFENAMETLDFNLILDRQVHQVRWLYNNSNKCTMVYDEKLVRLMVQKLQRKYEKCIATIKKFDAGIISMYDL